jgi:hypothetical protein
VGVRAESAGVFSGKQPLATSAGSEGASSSYTVW